MVVRRRIKESYDAVSAIGTEAIRAFVERKVEAGELKRGQYITLQMVSELADKNGQILGKGRGKDPSKLNPGFEGRKVTQINFQAGVENDRDNIAYRNSEYHQGAMSRRAERGGEYNSGFSDERTTGGIFVERSDGSDCAFVYPNTATCRSAYYLHTPDMPAGEFDGPLTKADFAQRIIDAGAEKFLPAKHNPFVPEKERPMEAGLSQKKVAARNVIYLAIGHESIGEKVEDL